MNTENTPEPEEVKATLITIEDNNSFNEQDEYGLWPIIVTHDEKHFNRMGFYCAIGERQNPKPKFEALLLEHKEEIEAKLKRVETHYNLDIIRFESKISHLEKKLDDEKIKLLNHKLDIDELLKIKDILKTDIDALEKDINLIYKNLGERKSKLIEKRIEDVKSELLNLIESYDSVTDRKNQINVRSYEDNKAAFKVKVDLFQKFANSYSDIYLEVKRKVKALNIVGISDYVSNFLIYAGFSAAIAAGWFFSIYAVQNELNSESTLFFLLSGLLNFGKEFVNASGNKIQAALYLTLCLILFLFITGVIAWFCQWALDKYEKVSSKNKLVFELAGDEKFVFNTEITAKTFLSFWLQVIPYIFVLGIAFIILILGNAAEKVSELDMSLSGQVAGTAIAFLCTGIAFIYITKVIEPRIQEQESNNIKPSWLRSNIELFLLITFFLVSILGLLLGFKALTDKVESNHFVSLLEFATCVLLTSFMLGYGLRYKGLIQTTEYLESKLKDLTNVIKDNSRAQPLSISLTEGKLFNKKYLELQEELLNLIILKTKSAKELLSNKEKRSNQNQTKKTESLWTWLFPQSKDTKDEKTELIISPIEEVYFPEVKNNIEELRVQIKNKSTELDITENKLSAIKEDKSEYITKLLNNIQKIENQIYNLRKTTSTRYQKWALLIDDLKKQGAKENNELWDGYNLGLWYRENNIGPTPDFYHTSPNN